MKQPSPPTTAAADAVAAPPPSAGSASTTSPAALEPFLLLARGARGAALVSLIKQVLESANVFVFGELLDLEAISELDAHPEHKPYLQLLTLFAYGTYKDYQSSHFPPLTEAMKRKLRLLTIATMVTRSKILGYDVLRDELDLESVRQLEDLIIEGANANVLRGKLDQKNSHFEVDYALGRDIKKADISGILSTLGTWCANCDSMLASIEQQVSRANSAKTTNLEHRAAVEKKAADTRAQLKTQQQLDGGGVGGGSEVDPDSRMEMDRHPDRREKKAAKGKGGLRGAGKTSWFQQNK